MPTNGGSAGDTIHRKFTTRATTGVPTALVGGVISIYKDASTTQSTTGVTLTASFDSVVGLNHVAIDTSADGTFYSNASHFEVVITTGTVNSVSVVGEVVGSFDLSVAVGDVNVTKWNGTAVAATAVAGIPSVALVAAGLDAITVTAPTAVATTFVGMIVQLWRLFFRPAAKAVSGHTIKTFRDDGTTVVSTQPYTDDGAGNETRGTAT